jgi:hypothetical protein
MSQKSLVTIALLPINSAATADSAAAAAGGGDATATSAVSPMSMNQFAIAFAASLRKLGTTCLVDKQGMVRLMGWTNGAGRSGSGGGSRSRSGSGSRGVNGCGGGGFFTGQVNQQQAGLECRQEEQQQDANDNDDYFFYDDEENDEPPAEDTVATAVDCTKDSGIAAGATTSTMGMGTGTGRMGAGVGTQELMQR